MKLYVGNLSKQVTDAQLNDLATPYGKPVSANVATERSSGDMFAVFRYAISSGTSNRSRWEPSGIDGRISPGRSRAPGGRLMPGRRRGALGELTRDGISLRAGDGAASGAKPPGGTEIGETYARVAGLPIAIERCELLPLVRDTTSGFTKVSIVARLSGGGHVGEGEDITWDQIDQIEFLRGGDHLTWLRGARTFDEFSTLLGLANLFPVEPIRESARFYRRWAFESAALDLALRQSGLALHDVVDRPVRPVNFVASVRGPSEPRPAARAARGRPRAPLQAGPDDQLGRRPGSRARASGLRRRRRHERLLPQHQRGDGCGGRPVPPRDPGAT